MSGAQKEFHLTFLMKQTYQTGIVGERAAAEWLNIHAGMKLVQTRYRNKAGEIDLIMMDHETVVFIEVKTRLHAPPGTGLLAVDRRKQQRIARAAILYLTENNMVKSQVRFDVAEVTVTEVIHVRNAFQPGNMFYR